jgi:proline iminopeptidase
MARVEDIDVHYASIGNGKPILVLGGPWLGHAYLRGFDALSDQYRVIHHDPRGSGRTPLGDPARAGLDGRIADIEGLRAALGIEKVNVVGHSFGATIGALYAAAHPDRVGALALCDPGPPFVPELMQRFGAEMMKRTLPKDAEEKRFLESSGAYERRDPKAVERSLRLTYMPFFDTRAAAEAIDLDVTEITAKHAPGTEMRLFHDLMARDPLASLAKIRSPSLVLHAEHDPLPEAFSRTLAERIPRAEFALVKGANHFAFAESPDTFFAALRPFLAKSAT